MKYSRLFILLFIPACTATRYSNHTAGEQLELKTLNYDQPLSYADVSSRFDVGATRSLITADLLVKGVDFAFEGIKTAISKSAEKYHQEYYFSLFNNTFYAQNSINGMLDPEGIRFKGFELKRKIKTDAGEELALYARFILDEEKLIDLYTQSKFYLRCDSLRLSYAKVKMNDRKWFLPWTLFLKKHENVNLDIEIDLLANWIDAQGLIHKKQNFGKFFLPVRKYPVATDTAFTDLPVNGYSYLIPRSATFCMDRRNQWEPCFGQGDFDIMVKVTENSTNTKFNKLLYDHADVIKELDSQPVKGLIKH